MNMKKSQVPSCDVWAAKTTMIYAKGGYSKEDTQMIYCVITRLEIAKLKTVVQEIDKNAFISIQNVADVLGGSMAKSDIH